MGDYYNALGVSRDVDQKEIQRAFRRLARKHHPDLNPGDPQAESKFKEINEAYEVLSDAEDRKKYDTYGDRWREADQIEAQRRASRSHVDFGGGRPYGSDGDVFAGLEDILGDLGDLGRFRAGAARSMNISLEEHVTISLQDAFTGAIFNANLTVRGVSRRFEVDIPPGVDNGSTVKVTPERGTEILFHVTVTPDRRFRRDGADLYVDADVPFEDVILGGEYEIETIDGRRIWVRIPAYSQNGRNIRLRRQGMPKLGSPAERGDLYVTVRPRMPRKLSDEELELIAQFRDIRPKGGSP